jgi:uncharacterized protein (DUF433 family)
MSVSDQELIERYIETPAAPPATNGAALRDYGVSVWALVAYYQAAGGDLKRVAADYHLPPEAVEAALAFYRQHRASIDARIAAHDAAFT